MVGVAGPTCSGKSTLERNLVVSLQDDVSILPFDDMSRGFENPSDMGLDSWEHPDCYRWEDYRQHLRAETRPNNKSPAELLGNRGHRHA